MVTRGSGATSASPAAGDEFVDPDGNTYGWKIETKPTSDVTSNLTAMDHLVHIYPEAQCKDDTEATVTKHAGSRNFAIMYKLEGSGTYCGDNN